MCCMSIPFVPCSAWCNRFRHRRPAGWLSKKSLTAQTFFCSVESRVRLAVLQKRKRLSLSISRTSSSSERGHARLDIHIYIYLESSTIMECSDGIFKILSSNLILYMYIAQKNYAPFTKNRLEIVTIQKKL
jgi:hypothetical protein